MVTNATIDISKYVNAAETSSAKSNADKSSGFENVFDNVSKAFNSEQSSNNNISDTKNKPEQKTETKSSTDNSNKKVEDKNENNEDKTVENKTDNKEIKDTTTDTETGKTEETADKDTAPVENKTDSTNQPTVLTNNIIEVLETSVSAATAAIVNTVNDAKGVNNADAATEGQAIATDNVASRVDTDLAQIAKNLTNGLVNQASNNKNSEQAQDVNQQNVQSKDLNQQAVASDSSNQLKVNAEAIAPIVVAAEANVKTDVNANSLDKDALSKTALTQDMLDKTNAKIVSVDTNSSGSSNSNNSNNLLNKQNAQEQAIKFSLEGSNKTSAKPVNIETPVITDATSQLNFSKTLDAVQPQATKELSQSDILSQINKQIDGLKDTGTTKVTIVLRPENLGKISLELISSKEGLTAKMTTDNAQVRDLLDKSLNSLKDTLGGQGVSVNNVSVKLNETQKQDNAFTFNEQTNQQQQQNSQNPKQAEGNAFSFDKEINSVIESETEISETTESSISNGSHMGQVDYKV